MIILDDILLSPARGLVWVFRQVQKAADQEMARSGEQVRTELRELYRDLQAGRISESEFDARERPLLDALDAMQGAPDTGRQETGGARQDE